MLQRHALHASQANNSNIKLFGSDPCFKSYIHYTTQNQNVKKKILFYKNFFHGFLCSGVSLYDLIIYGKYEQIMAWL